MNSRQDVEDLLNKYTIGYRVIQSFNELVIIISNNFDAKMIARTLRKIFPAIWQILISEDKFTNREWIRVF